MPLYEYQCGKCREKFEVLRNLSDDDSDVRCPKCGDRKPQKLVSAFACGLDEGSGGGSGCGPAPSG